MISPRNYPDSRRVRIRPAVSYDISRPTTTLPLTKIRLLEQLVAELQQALESLSEIEISDISQGLDFYEEVKRFEIELIKRALIFVDGHQRKAARLLNLNATTLNAKVRTYQIHMAHVVGPRCQGPHD
jgi:DNA-binding NtrC family response regulator